ncbi:MAG TPA: P-loop NTPase fold protein [Conexibacter sp.]|nr:P-loop NTPase fold protein [Conexibacter sp.]
MLAGDTPVLRPDQDEFGREPLARRVAAEVRSAPVDGGFVIALNGPWGSGKTSIANMATQFVEAEDGVIVVPFSPWMFSGHDDLVARFFAELTATLGKRPGKLREVAEHISRYAGAVAGVARFIPLAGETAGTALDAAGKLASAAAGSTPTLDDLYDRLADALRQLDPRILVFIDDIDRLTDQEIRDVVRLVKSVGDLPSIVYLLAFDRTHVEAVLGGSAGDARDRGRAYLEKIVQVRHDVPPPRAALLVSIYLRDLVQRAIAGCTGGQDGGEWLNRLGPALSDLVRTPRDAKRVANAVSAGLELHQGEVAVVDIVGLEALRVLEPEVHARLADLAGILFGDGLSALNGDDDPAIEERRRRLEDVLAHARAPVAVRKLLQQLFPSGSDILGGGRREGARHVEDRENRVSVPRIFWRYVYSTIPETEVSSAEAEHVAKAFDDPDEFSRRLEGYAGRRLEDMITRLGGYWEGCDPAVVVSIGTVLMRAASRLPADASPFRMTLDPVVWQYEWLLGSLLSCEPDRERRIEKTKELITNTPNVSARLRLIAWFGTFPGQEEAPEREPLAERRLLDAVETERQMARLQVYVLDAQPDKLALEVAAIELLRTVLLRDKSRAQRRFAKMAAEPSFLLMLLRRFTTRILMPGREVAYEFEWADLTATLGEARARERVLALHRIIDVASLDDLAAQGYLQALASARRAQSQAQIA